MTVVESRQRLRDRYIKWYLTASQMNNCRTTEDAKYSWWEREKNCREWCGKGQRYIAMSDTKTLNIMREWVRQRINN